MNLDEIKNNICERIEHDFNRMLSESSLSRVWGKLQERSVAFITAFRGDLTRSENVKRNRKLYAELMQVNKNIGVTKVLGSYIEDFNGSNPREVKEETFMVTSPFEGDDNGFIMKTVARLGQKFDQDSVLVKEFEKPAYLIGTSRREESYPPFGQKEKVGEFSGGKVSEFLSRIRNRPFVFESCEPIKYPTTKNGIWGLKLLANKDMSEL